MPSRPAPLPYLSAFEPDAWKRTMAAREAFFESSAPLEELPEFSDIRQSILHSWRRSHDHGVRPDDQQLPVSTVQRRAERLRRAAEPVMNRLGDQLDGSHAWAMILDRDCTQIGSSVGARSVIARNESRGSRPGAVFSENRVGTNGAGLSAEMLEPFVVVGPEHYREFERNLVSVGAPVRDSLNRLVGIVSLNCVFASATSLLVPFARDVAWAIRERLAEETHSDERDLFDLFAQQSKRPSQAVLAVSDSIFIGNRAARQFFNIGGEAEIVSKRVLEAVAEGDDCVVTVALRAGDVTLRCKAVPFSDGNVGAIVSIGRTKRTVLSGAGVSVTAQRVRARLLAAHDSGQSVLVSGEHGVGKTRLAQTLKTQPNYREFEGALSMVQPDLWLETLQESAAEPEATVVLRHLDQVDASLERAVAAIVRDARAHMVATANNPALEMRPLDQVFPVRIHIPPLRDRQEEVPQLIEDILDELNQGVQQIGCSAEAASALGRFTWVGNISQLRQVLASSAQRAQRPEIMLEDLPSAVLAASGSRALSKMERNERELLFEALKSAAWNRERAAHELGISRATIYRKIKQLGILIPTSRN